MCFHPLPPPITVTECTVGVRLTPWWLLSVGGDEVGCTLVSMLFSIVSLLIFTLSSSLSFKEDIIYNNNNIIINVKTITTRSNNSRIL